MSDLLSPVLSPSFAKASRFSRLLAVLFSIAFWLTLVWIAASPVLIVWPKAGSFKMDDLLVTLTGLSVAARIGAVMALAVGTLPSLFILHHARRLFFSFAQGEVFAAKPIGDIRAAGIWLMVSFLTSAAAQIGVNYAMGVRPPGHDLDLKPLSLIFGLATFSAAYVMVEACRIADENAGIV